MSTLTSPQYVLDPTGRLPANLIPNELQALTGVAGRDYSFILPLAGPFFAESMQVNLKTIDGTTRLLTEGVDYYLTHFFLGATRAIGKTIYASITFLNNSLRGTLILRYQALGGEWSVDPAAAALILADQTHNPREKTWEQVSGKPNIFPVIDHEWNLIDMVGMSQVKNSLDAIVDALTASATSAMTQHIQAVGNAHHLTASDIGAVSHAELTAAVQAAIQQSGTGTDSIQEGTTNKWFTVDRVLQSNLVGYTPGNAEALSEQDTVLGAFRKVMALIVQAQQQIAKCATMERPQFSGLGSQNLIKLDLLTSPLSVDISKAEAFQINVKASGAIAFNTGFVGDMTGKVVEFSVTTINDSTGNAYAIAWPSNVKWVDGTPPPRTTTANAKDYWYFVSEDNCTTWTGSLSNANPR